MSDTSPRAVDEILLTRDVVITCGPGGVGKTTLSASLALRAALLGRRAIVCTIDPAKRLATSLGLPELGNEEVLVSKERLAAAGLAPTGSLSALMLDTKRTFDRLIERWAKTEEACRRVLENRFYREISSQVVGSQEFMAMEKLYELHEKKAYDLIVLDTPPTKHAIDFLTAPRRMNDVLDASILDVLLRPFDLAGRFSVGIMARAAKKLARKIDDLVGLQFIHDLAEFFGAFEGFYEGFRERASRVERLLREPGTAFVVVSSPSPEPLEEARYFCEKLRELEIPLAALVLNRVQTSPLAGAPEAVREAAERAGPEAALAAAAAARACGASEAAAEAAERGVGELLDQDHRSREERRRVDEALLGARATVRVLEVPRFATDVWDLAGLARLHEHL